MAAPFAAPGPVDFHLHTWASDGAHDPYEMAAAARRSRLAAWAITDHDTLAGWAAVRTAPGLVPGVEITAGDSGREVHVVSLGIDPAHDGLARLLSAIRALRLRRIDALLARMPAEIRRDLTAAQVKPAQADAVGRLHLALALVRCGAVARVRDAFTAHLADEHIADPDLPQFPGVGQVAETIRAAGGVAILAHPGGYRDPVLVRHLLGLGLDGFEAGQGDLDAELLALPGLLVSVGSDTHRISSRRRPGSVEVAGALLIPLRERIGADSCTPPTHCP
jgi:predicted metal-dependent phosphoesterase TrpH